MNLSIVCEGLARVERFELPSTVLETAILPLNYTRKLAVGTLYAETDCKGKKNRQKTSALPGGNALDIELLT